MKLTELFPVDKMRHLPRTFRDFMSDDVSVYKGSSHKQYLSLSACVYHHYLQTVFNHKLQTITLDKQVMKNQIKFRSVFEGVF